MKAVKAAMRSAQKKQKRKLLGSKYYDHHRAKNRGTQLGEQDKKAKKEPAWVGAKVLQSKLTKKAHKAANLDEYLPLLKIENGIVYTKDGRYLKIIEIGPVNFLLRSLIEQRSIIYGFIRYLKICPVKVQIKIISKKADISKFLEKTDAEIAAEQDAHCRILQEDYKQFFKTVGSKEAIARRFFLIYEYEPFLGGRSADEQEAIVTLQTIARTTKTYLSQCGNVVVEPADEDENLAEIFYSMLNRTTSVNKPMSERIQEVVNQYMLRGEYHKLDSIPINEFIAPENIDFSNGRYVVMDGLYHSYLLIPGDGYKTHVVAGWMSMLVNAGEGIDTDIFFYRQPKDRIILKLGQQLRINRSKIRDTSDTNTDFDDLESAISSGYFLKDGLASNQDFFYVSVLVTVTAANAEELEWRVNEVKKLMISQDMSVVQCVFRQEQAFNSALPLASLDRALYERSKRNVLTAGAASFYPFLSFEMSDANGVLVGVNKHNNSLVIIDFFNSQIYRNANVVVAGTSGSGKTFFLQLLATRLRRKQIQTFILAPLKGHEFRRACKKIGGSFISISPASNHCINIMEIRKVDTAATELLDGYDERSMLAAKVQSLHIFFSLLVPDLSHEERQLLDEMIIQTYAKFGITHDNQSLVDPEKPEQFREMPVLGDLHEILKERPETKRIANILVRLVHGSAKCFNQPTNVQLDNLYTVLDISDLSGDLVTVGMFVALDMMWAKAKEDRTVAKSIMIDECWRLLGQSSNPLAANYVLEIAKIIRAYGGQAVFATQDLNDFLSLENGQIGRGVMNNCKTKVVLNLEEEEAQRVQEVLRLSDAEVMDITHFQRGSGLIIANNNTLSVEFVASQLEKELITTDRTELQEIVRRKKAQE